MELLVPLEVHSKKPIYEQIYTYIREEIRRGNLREGERLPSTRRLAENLKVSRSTTQMAYEQLIAEGYIEARPCRGNYVAHIGGLVRVEQRTPVLMQMEREIPDEKKSAGDWIDFSPRGIDLDHFPYNTWRKLSKNALVDDNKEYFHSGTPQGEPGLRTAILAYLHAARGVNAAEEQIIIGAGSEYLLMLLSLILGHEKGIAMENPTYKQAYRVFCSQGHPVYPVSMDAFGMNPEKLAQSGANVAYIMPAHQYPTGIIMPVGRRQKLLNWAAEEPGRYLIEDDYDSEFRYKGKPIPALQGMDREGTVIYIGTFSKSIAPAIRVSYMVLPEKLLQVYREKAGFYASTVSRIDQHILYQFLSQGYFERHLNRMRGIYRSKHDTLLTALRPLEKIFDIHGENAGLHILLTDRQGRTEEELTELAKSRQVRVYGMSSYYIDPLREHRPGTVLIGFANRNEAEIVRGVQRLTECWG
ncbi:MAG: PLP-dependent aminotransferase family protein [Clostridiales bacterium]|nr:PLP-dependent aminotransferase family protein [Clostridiales bacterium]